MANKRNRQKQRNSSKTIEGYERQLLKEIAKWRNEVRELAVGSTKHRDAHRELHRFLSAHEHLRRYYFNL